MDKLAARTHFATAFRRAATQLNTYKHAAGWLAVLDVNLATATTGELEQHAEVAAQWANAGFEPHEAAPLIAAGTTVEEAVLLDGPELTPEAAASLAGLVAEAGTIDLTTRVTVTSDDGDVVTVLVENEALGY